ncbi:MAG: ribonuclease N [Burkholderiales bacterium 66-5]|nr:MAG: ribonuclease N [Burkholderiales bacterium 66-5]
MGISLAGGARQWLAAGLVGMVCMLALPVGARGLAEPAAATPISVQQLPANGRATYALIQRGGPFPHDKDGSVFGNYERQLPVHGRGYYREYTVRTPGQRGRGAQRIVCGGAPRTPDACYYTNDHYASFRVIAP